MKITVHEGDWHERYLHHLGLEGRRNGEGYFTDRNLAQIMDNLAIKPDLRDISKRTYKRKGSPIEFLDSGCGEGRTIASMRSGLDGMVRFTGITLNLEHANLMQELLEELKPDEVFVGPLEHFPGKDFDFVLDFLGPAYYFPAMSLKKYATQILGKNGLLLTRLPLYHMNFSDRVGFLRDKEENAVERLKEIGLEVVESGMPNNVEMDALLRRAT